MMIDTNRHVPTPIVSTRPRLYRPRWAAIIMLPKPTIVVVELTKMALMTLADGVFCGPSAVFTNVVNPRAEVERKDDFRPTHVGRGASIGANATIVCGHTIGDYSFVAAGAVVTGDVPPHALMMGVPARRTGWVSHDGEILGPDLVCPRSGRRSRRI